MNKFQNVILGALFVFAISFNAAALAADVDQPASTIAQSQSQPADQPNGNQQTAPEHDRPNAAAPSSKKVERHPGGVLQVLAGVISFGAIIASAVTNVPADSVKLIALSIGADQVTKKEDDATSAAVTR